MNRPRRLPIEALLGLAIVPMVQRSLRGKARRVAQPFIARYALGAGIAVASAGLALVQRWRASRAPLETKAYPPAHVP